jgi:hypothetical protein
MVLTIAIVLQAGILPVPAAADSPQLISFQVYSDGNCTLPITGLALTNLSTPSQYLGCSNSSISSFSGQPVMSSTVSCQQSSTRLYLQAVMFYAAGDTTCANTSDSTVVLAYGTAGCVPGWYTTPQNSTMTTIYATLSCNEAAVTPNNNSALSVAPLPLHFVLPVMLAVITSSMLMAVGM